MLLLTKAGHDPIQVGTECLGDGIWRACCFDAQGRVLKVLGSTQSAAAAAGLALSFLIKKDLAGWRAEFPKE